MLPATRLLMRARSSLATSSSSTMHRSTAASAHSSSTTQRRAERREWREVERDWGKMNDGMTTVRPAQPARLDHTDEDGTYSSLMGAVAVHDWDGEAAGGETVVVAGSTAAMWTNGDTERSEATVPTEGALGKAVAASVERECEVSDSCPVAEAERLMARLVAVAAWLAAALRL